VTGKINWGLWVDPDGCMHWWADGGFEGYMTPRRDPKTGQHMCLERNTCAVPNTDVLFASDSARLTSTGKAWLEQFFASAGAFAYAIYGHTDARASASYNQRLSEQRANAVAQVARASGAVVERVAGFGESRPVAAEHHGREHAEKPPRRNRLLQVPGMIQKLALLALVAPLAVAGCQSTAYNGGAPKLIAQNKDTGWGDGSGPRDGRCRRGGHARRLHRLDHRRRCRGLRDHPLRSAHRPAGLHHPDPARLGDRQAAGLERFPGFPALRQDHGTASGFPDRAGQGTHH
jgi:hypothetical protein